MQGKGLASSEKAEKIVLDRVKDRLVDLVRKADNTERFSRIARENFNHFYSSMVSSSLDLGVKKGRMLDLGTQFGMCALNLARQDYDFDITSLQDSVRGVEIGKKFAEEDMSEGIKWEMGKPENLPFADHKFDLVVSGFDMHHWENPVAVFSEMSRVMKTNGVMLMADFRREAFSLMMPVLKTLSMAVKSDELYEEMRSSFRSSYRKGEIEILLAESGLEGCEVSKDLQFVYVVKAREEKRHVLVKFSPE